MSITPDPLSHLIKQISDFDSQTGSLRQVSDEETSIRLAGLRALAGTIQFSLKDSGVSLDVREIADFSSAQRVTDLFHGMVSVLVSREFSVPLEKAIRTALQTGELSAVRDLVSQINKRGMDVNQCKFSHNLFLLEYLFQPNLFNQKLNPSVLEGLLALSVNPNLYTEIPPIGNLLHSHIAGDYTHQETVAFLRVLANYRVDPNLPTPEGETPLLFMLHDKIYGWTLEDKPGEIEEHHHNIRYVASPEIFEIMIPLLTPQNRQALLASFLHSDRQDLIHLFSISR